MKSCLVVEDSPVVREIACRLIKELGLEPREAEDAGEAVEACRESKVDAVLLDWDLPSMGALDFLRGAATLEADMRPEIILCATENDAQQFTLARAAGAAHHILKPFDSDTLEKILIEAGCLAKPETGLSASNVKAIG